VAEAVPVIVTVANPEKIDEVSAASKARGMTQVSILRSLGLIKGFVDAKSIEVIAKIEGVQSVERERQFKVPNPQSRIQ
jgi:hypothetical protein